MKMRVFEIRELIRESLAVPKGAVVSVFGDDNVHKIVLWSPTLMVSAMKAEGAVKGDPDSSFMALATIDHDEDDTYILGIIGLDRLKKSAAWNDSGKGWEVVNVAAKKGYGPLMFNFAIGDLGAVIPDRNTMTDDSTRVWKKFDTGASPGVKLKPLDDEDNPKTKTKIDDAPTLKKKSKSDLYKKEDFPLAIRNTAAVGQGISTKALQIKADQQIKKICSIYALEPDVVLEEIEAASGEFFQTYFANAVMS